MCPDSPCSCAIALVGTGGRSRPARERSARDAARFPRPRWLNPLDARADSSASAPAKAALEAEGRHTADRNSKGPYRRRRAGSRTSDGTSTSTCTCPSSTAPTRSKTNRPVSTASGHQRTPNSNACSTPSPPASPAPWKGRGCCCAMTRAPFSTSSPPTISTHSSPPRLYAAINKPTASTTPAHHQASSRSERNRCVRPQPNSPSPRLPVSDRALTAPTGAPRPHCASPPCPPGARPSCHARVAAEPESIQLDRTNFRARTGNEPDNDHTNTPTATQIGRLFLLSLRTWSTVSGLKKYCSNMTTSSPVDGREDHRDSNGSRYVSLDARASRENRTLGGHGHIIGRET